QTNFDDMESGVDRLLNQDEIDSMLGFSVGEMGSGGRAGIRAIVDSGTISYERLPMLEIIFERMVRHLSTSLRNFFNDNIEVALDSIRSVRFGDYVNSIPLPAMIAVFKAEEWDNFGLVTVESNLTYAVLDTMLGGRRGGGQNPGLKVPAWGAGGNSRWRWRRGRFLRRRWRERLRRNFRGRGFRG
ncbi:hypothetical protein HC928_25255, partial [bacterium]|nr:hypothetical protein [bacterium]